MQLGVMVEGMGITDRQATGIARAGLLTVNDREHPLEGDPRENLLDGLLQRLDLTVTQRAIPGRQGSARTARDGRRARDHERRLPGRRTRIGDLPIRPEMLIWAGPRVLITASI
jgi:hypothetical protein